MYRSAHNNLSLARGVTGDVRGQTLSHGRWSDWDVILHNLCCVCSLSAVFMFQSLRWGLMVNRTWSTFTGWMRTTRISNCHWGSRRSRSKASSCPPTAPPTGELYRYLSLWGGIERRADGRIYFEPFVADALFFWFTKSLIFINRCSLVLFAQPVTMLFLSYFVRATPSNWLHYWFAPSRC